MALARPPSLSGHRREVPLWLVAGWVFFAVFIAAGVLLWEKQEQRRHIETWQNRLTALAERRAFAIETYLAERRGEADVIADVPSVRALFDRKAPPASSEVRELFGRIVQELGYSSVLAVDLRGNIAASAGAGRLSGEGLTPPIEAAKEGRQFASGLFRDSRGGLALSFSAPVFDVRGEGDAPAPGSALGAVVLVVDPARGLYPLLSKHSPETRTEESFLVREEKGAIQLLSPVRLGSRKPLDVFEKESAWFASAPSLGAKEAFGEFHDYRGQAVLAATRSIPRPGWGLVVKVDREEAMRPFERLRLWAWAGAAGSFLLLTAAALAWSRHVSSRHYRDLAQRDARYRALLEETNDAIAAEAGGQFVFANPAFLRLFECQADEVLDKPFHLFFAPKSREKLLEVRTALLDGDPVPETLEVSAQTAGGARFDVEIRPALTSLEGRDAMQMTLRDITRRKHAEVRLRRSEERYRSLFERNLAGVYRSDFSGRLLDCNEAFARILGFESREEALTHPTTSYYFDREGRSKLIARLLAERSLTNLEVRLRRKDGEPVWVLENVTLTRAEDGSLSILEGTIVDISDRQRADEAVRESEERFRRLADATFEGIAITENGKFLETNPQFVEMFGYAPEDLPGRNVLELVAPESRDQVAEAIRAGYDRPYETVCLRKNGTVFPVEASGRPFPYQGRTVRVTAVRDIAERKRAEEVLRQSEEKYRDFVENSDALICLHDLAGKILSVNPAAARSLGYEPDDCVGKNIRAFLSSETHPAFDDYLLKIRREGTAQGHMAVLTGRGERRIWQYHNSLRAEGAAGPVVRGMAIDVTDQRRAEEALRESEALYRAVTETATDAIVTMDSESTIHFANAAAERIFGYTREEMLGRSLQMLMPERLRHAHEAEISRYNRTGKKRLSWASLQLPGLHKSGREVPLEISFGEVVSGGKRLFTGIIRDITERARAEEALRRSEERYRLLFERNLAGVYRSTADGRLLECNEAFARIMGYSSPEEAMARPSEAFHESPGEREEFLSRLRAEGSLVNFESRARRKDGSRVWTLENVTILPAEGDRPEVLQGAVIDITQRKAAEEALRNSEERYRTILENIEDGYFEVDLAGNFTLVNESLARILGFPREELLGLNDRGYTDAENAKKLFETFHRVYETGSPAHGFDWAIVRKDGTIRSVEASVSLIRDAAGQPIGFRGIARDITDRKRGEAALQRSLRQQEALLNNIPDAAWMKDSEGRFTAVNNAFARSVGRPREEILGRTDFDFCTRELAEKFRAEDREVIRGGKALRVANVYTPAGGNEIAFETVKAPIWGEESVPVGTAGIGRDVTERKRGEEALRRSEEKHRGIFDFAPVGIYQSLPDGTLLTANAMLATILGHESVEELLARNLKDIYHDPSEREEMSDRLESGGVERGVAVRWKRKSGTPVWVELDAHAVRDEERQPRYFEGFVRDITERKHAEEERRNLQEQLTQSQKIEAVGQLAGGIAHDFNNLLTAIGGYSELLLGDLTPGDPRRDHAAEIHRAGERAASLTRQLLAYSRRQVLAPKVLDLNAVVSDLERILCRLIGEHIELRARPFRGLWNVKADPGQLEQAILNLAINARDAMPDGGKLTIETANVELDEAYALSHATVVPGSYAMVAVGDTGTGMTDEVMARVFEPFFTTKEKGKGTGLGLSTTYGIVKQSGGYIWCYSEPGHGTSFKIYLPRVRGKVEEAAAPAPSPIQNGDETILLVEDEPEVRSLVRKILAMRGYTVFPAAGPEEAMLLSRRFEGRIGLLLSDFVMPGLSGKQLADRLADSRPEMKVLFMSGYTDDAIVHRGILDPGTAFLQKPFTPQALARKVREVLDAPAEEFKIS